MKNLILLTWALVLFGLSACNTTRGAGEDIEATGEATQEAAEEVEEEIENDRANRM